MSGGVRETARKVRKHRKRASATHKKNRYKRVSATHKKHRYKRVSATHKKHRYKRVSATHKKQRKRHHSVKYGGEDKKAREKRREDAKRENNGSEVSNAIKFLEFAHKSEIIKDANTTIFDLLKNIINYTDRSIFSTAPEHITKPLFPRSLNLVEGENFDGSSFFDKPEYKDNKIRDYSVDSSGTETGPFTEYREYLHQLDDVYKEFKVRDIVADPKENIKLFKEGHEKIENICKTDLTNYYEKQTIGTLLKIIIFTCCDNGYFVNTCRTKESSMLGRGSDATMKKTKYYSEVITNLHLFLEFLTDRVVNTLLGRGAALSKSSMMGLYKQEQFKDFDSVHTRILQDIFKPDNDDTKNFYSIKYETIKNRDSSIIPVLKKYLLSLMTFFTTEGILDKTVLGEDGLQRIKNKITAKEGDLVNRREADLGSLVEGSGNQFYFMLVDIIECSLEPFSNMCTNSVIERLTNKCKLYNYLYINDRLNGNSKDNENHAYVLRKSKGEKNPFEQNNNDNMDALNKKYTLYNLKSTDKAVDYLAKEMQKSITVKYYNNPTRAGNRYIRDVDNLKIWEKIFKRVLENIVKTVNINVDTFIDLYGKFLEETMTGDIKRLNILYGGAATLDSLQGLQGDRLFNWQELEKNRGGLAEDTKLKTKDEINALSAEALTTYKTELIQSMTNKEDTDKAARIRATLETIQGLKGERLFNWQEFVQNKGRLAEDTKLKTKDEINALSAEALTTYKTELIQSMTNKEDTDKAARKRATARSAKARAASTLNEKQANRDDISGKTLAVLLENPMMKAMGVKNTDHLEKAIGKKDIVPAALTNDNINMKYTLLSNSQRDVEGGNRIEDTISNLITFDVYQSLSLDVIKNTQKMQQDTISMTSENRKTQRYVSELLREKRSWMKYVEQKLTRQEEIYKYIWNLYYNKVIAQYFTTPESIIGDILNKQGNPSPFIIDNIDNVEHKLKDRFIQHIGYDIENLNVKKVGTNWVDILDHSLSHKNIEINKLYHGNRTILTNEQIKEIIDKKLVEIKDFTHEEDSSTFSTKRWFRDLNEESYLEFISAFDRPFIGENYKVESSYTKEHLYINLLKYYTEDEKKLDFMIEGEIEGKISMYNNPTARLDSELETKNDVRNFGLNTMALYRVKLIKYKRIEQYINNLKDDVCVANIKTLINGNNISQKQLISVDKLEMIFKIITFTKIFDMGGLTDLLTKYYLLIYNNVLHADGDAGKNFWMDSLDRSNDGLIKISIKSLTASIGDLRSKTRGSSDPAKEDTNATGGGPVAGPLDETIEAGKTVLPVTAVVPGKPTDGTETQRDPTVTEAAGDLAGAAGDLAGAAASATAAAISAVGDGVYSYTIGAIQAAVSRRIESLRIKNGEADINHIKTLKELFSTLLTYDIDELVKLAKLSETDKNKVYKSAAKILIRNNIMGISVDTEAINGLYKLIKDSHPYIIIVKYQGSEGEELFKLAVKNTETIKTVLNRLNGLIAIKEKEDGGRKFLIDKGNRVLLFRGNIMEESQTMLSSKIGQGSELELREKPVAAPPAGAADGVAPAADTSVAAEQYLEISVKTLTNGTFPYSVKSIDSIKSLKDTMTEMGISLKDKELSFEAKQLEDARTFADYNIQNGSEIQMVESKNMGAE